MHILCKRNATLGSDEQYRLIGLHYSAMANATGEKTPPEERVKPPNSIDQG